MQRTCAREAFNAQKRYCCKGRGAVLHAATRQLRALHAIFAQALRVKVAKVIAGHLVRAAAYVAAPAPPAVEELGVWIYVGAAILAANNACIGRSDNRDLCFVAGLRVSHGPDEHAKGKLDARGEGLRAGKVVHCEAHERRVAVELSLMDGKLPAAADKTIVATG